MGKFFVGLAIGGVAGYKLFEYQLCSFLKDLRKESEDRLNFRYRNYYR